MIIPTHFVTECYFSKTIIVEPSSRGVNVDGQVVIAESSWQIQNLEAWQCLKLFFCIPRPTSLSKRKIMSVLSACSPGALARHSNLTDIKYVYQRFSILVSVQFLSCILKFQQASSVSICTAEVPSFCAAWSFSLLGRSTSFRIFILSYE